MDLFEYHQRYVTLSQENILHGLQAKEYQLGQVFSQLNLTFNENSLRIAILGCADKRFVKGHQELFGRLLYKPLELTTFDINTDHLNGENRIIKHDCTKPLPQAPYNVIFSHILLKFIPENQQWSVIKNSYDALKSGGVALHFMDVGGKSLPTSMLKEGFNKVILDVIKNKLKESSIKFINFKVIKNKESSGYLECLVLFKE